MSLYAFQENAPSATAAAGTDIIPINQSGVLKQITANALLAGGVVDTTATTLAVTQATHSGRTVTVSSTAPIAITLPQATGTGATYRFNLRVAATATQHTIKVGNSTDVMSGVYMSLCTTAATLITFATSATSDTITLNGTTTGGYIGATFTIRDIKTGFFEIVGIDTCASTTTTPFSASV